MDLKCLQCGHEFEGSISHDELGWHSICPECGGSFDVDVPDGHIVMAFTDKVDGDNPYLNFTDDLHDACVFSYYAFSSRKEFLKKWEEKVYNEEPDGMWYWIIEGDHCIACGGPNPEDIELICDAWGIEVENSYDIWCSLEAAYASTRTDTSTCCTHVAYMFQ